MNEGEAHQAGKGPQLSPLQPSVGCTTVPQASQAVSAGHEALTWGGIGLYLQHLSAWDTEAGRANNPHPNLLGTQEPN